MIGPAKKYLKKHAATVDLMRERMVRSRGPSGAALISKLLFNFLRIALRMQSILKPDERTRELWAMSDQMFLHFLYWWPDFTLGFIGTLHGAATRHWQKPVTFHRALVALRERKPIVNSYGRTVHFDDASDLEICDHLKIPKSEFKEAKRCLARIDKLNLKKPDWLLFSE